MNHNETDVDIRPYCDALKQSTIDISKDPFGLFVISVNGTSATKKCPVGQETISASKDPRSEIIKIICQGCHLHQEQVNQILY